MIQNSQIYYGCWIVVASIICQFVSMSVGQAIVGIFMEPVTTDLEWQVWQYTLGPSLGIGLGALSGLFAGPIVDKQGPRNLILVGVLVSSICLFALGRQSNLWTFWLINIITGLIGWNLYGSLTVNATLNKWFIRQRGWALALGSVGISLGGLITPTAVTAIVDSIGWRDGYGSLAVAVLLLVLPTAFVMRRMPEDYGLLPDGIDEPEQPERPISEPKDTLNKAKPSSDAKSLTSRQAIRTKSFWFVVLGFGCNQAALSSVLVHAIPFATDAGFTRSVAALALTINGLGNLSAKPVWGYTLQRFPPRRLIVTAFSLSSLGVSLMLAAAAIGEQSLLFLGFFFYGFGFGGTIPLSEFLWTKYFGREHIGAIRGISQPLSIIGPTFGPVLIGLWFDVTQTYQPAFLTIIGVYLSGAFFIWISREPIVTR